MTGPAALLGRLRDRLVSGLHRGRVHPGDRLMSVRGVADEFGVNPRAVMDAYRVLEAEGLIEIRGRSGAYVAQQERLGGVLSETSRWLAGVVADGWMRHLALPQLVDLFARATMSRRLRCAFVESTEDHMVAFTAELETGFGLHCEAVHLPGALDDAGEHFDASGLQAALAVADFVATTVFHGALMRQVCEKAGKPLVVVSATSDLVRSVENHLRTKGTLTVVCVDPRFGERIRLVYAGNQHDVVRVVLAHDAWEVAQLDPQEPVLLTRAARRRLLDDVHLALVAPHSPTLSVESAREVAELIIRLNLGHDRPADGGPTGDRSGPPTAPAARPRVRL